MDDDTPHHPWRQQTTTARLLLVLVGVVLLASGTLLGWLILTDRARTLLAAQQANTVLARSLAEQGEHVFESIDVLLRYLANQSDPADPAPLAGFRARYAESVPFLRNVARLDTRGIMVTSSHFPAVIGRSFAIRDYFIAHRDHAALGLLVSPPLVSPADQHSRILTLSRRLNTPQGAFAGVIVASLSLDRLEQFYHSLDLLDGQSITLLERDGAAVVQIGQRDDASPLRSEHWLTAAPYGIVINRTLDSALADWRERCRFSVLVALAANGLILSLALLLIRRLRQEANLHQQIRHQATHDPLTGLYNRAEFDLRLQHACAAVEASDETIEHALLYIDLDHFKAVNDRGGHLAGDELLRQIAQRLHAHARSSDVAARMGGDEFALLLHDCPHAKAVEIGNALVATLRAYRLHWGEQHFSVGASVGVATITAGCGGPQTVMRQADSACYAAKARGRGQVAHGAGDDLKAT